MFPLFIIFINLRAGESHLQNQKRFYESSTAQWRANTETTKALARVQGSIEVIEQTRSLRAQKVRPDPLQGLAVNG